MAYLKRLYERTMREAYGLAEKEILAALADGGDCLDCGAGGGHMFDRLGLPRPSYHGVEWSPDAAAQARERGLDVATADLNDALPFPDNTFRCVFGLSVLEHLLRPCRYLRECHRVLEPGGTIVLLTPNIATYFTALLILLGRMPSSGPHADSEALAQLTSGTKVSEMTLDPESDTPSHRHLIVFSYRVLGAYLAMLGFEDIRGRGFGQYPFPQIMQPALERLDPWHCHQMVFVARKR